MNEEQALKLVELQGKATLTKAEKNELSNLLSLLNSEDSETSETSETTTPKVESFTGANSTKTNKDVLNELIIRAGFTPPNDNNLSVRFLTFHQNSVVTNKDKSDFISMITTDAVKTKAIIAKISIKHFEKFGFKQHVDFGTFTDVTKICFGYEGNGKIAYYSEYLNKVVPYPDGFNIRQIVGTANESQVAQKRIQYESVNKAIDTFESVMNCKPDMGNTEHREVYFGIVSALAK